MRKVTFSNKYAKDVKRMIKQRADLDELEKLITKLRGGEKIPAKHKDHALAGDLFGFRGLHISSDWILIYALDDEEVYLARTGSHAEIYKR